MATFNPIRGTQSAIDSTPIIDGQELFTTDTNRIYIDNGSNRLLYQGSVVDSTLSTTSENPVQNKVITKNTGLASDLRTTTKTNIVSAVNEIDSSLVDIDSNLSSISDNAIVFPTSYSTVMASASDGSTYTASENCWITAIGVTNSTNNNLSLSVTESGIYNQVSRPVASVQIAISIPVKKGQTVSVSVTGLSSLMLRKNV